MKFISHAIFLTPEERQSLNNDEDKTLDTVGVCNSSSRELLRHYLITNEVPPGITEMEGGYRISIGKKKRFHLLDIPKGGSGCLSLNFIEQDKQLLTIHQIMIQDISVLVQSTVCGSWVQSLSKKD